VNNSISQQEKGKNDSVKKENEEQRTFLPKTKREIHWLNVRLIFYFRVMAKHYELGKEGEQLAVDYLLKKGYKILESNWRYQKAEVDIIVQKETILAAVEVKTRSTNEFGDPQDFVKPKKIKLLVSAVNEYVVQNDLDVEVRFDIIAITKTNTGFDIEHLEDAFFHF